MKLSDVITPGDKIDIKMLHEANQEDNGGEIAKIYQSAVSDIFSDQELEISMPTSGGRMVLFQLERECSIVFYTKGGMYNCTAVVKKRYRKENLYLLRIVITSGLQKFQRREFFRIPQRKKRGKRLSFSSGITAFPSPWRPCPRGRADSTAWRDGPYRCGRPQSGRWKENGRGTPSQRRCRKKHGGR